MKVVQAYDEWAATYDADRNLTRDLDEQVTREILAGLRFESVLEFGCGTGKNTAFFAAIAQRVQALDFSVEMLEQARQKSAAANVTFGIADITKRWPISDDSMALVACNLVLEHIADLAFVFAEAARVLVKGGQIFISELHPFRQYLGVQARFERGQETRRIDAFVHNVTDFTDGAAQNNLALESMKEWRHEQDGDKPPRLISFLFVKP